MSSSGSRPGGLTALAVINFIFGGLGALGLLALVALFSLVNVATEGKAVQEIPGQGALVIGLAIGVIAVVLLIISGIGYLQQKKFMGRILGTAYGVIAITNGVIQLILLNQPMGIMTIVGFIYPVLTLVLLNTTFKDDFVNP